MMVYCTQPTDSESLLPKPFENGMERSKNATIRNQQLCLQCSNLLPF